MKTVYLSFFTVLALLPFLAGAAPVAAKNKIATKALSFVENKGQVTGPGYVPRTDIDLKLETPGMSVFIGGGQMHYMWRKMGGSEQLQKPATQISDHDRRPASTVETYRMDVILVGANKNAEIIKQEQQAYFENYYLPQCPDGITAHTYNKVTYKNIYPNIDWVLYTSNNQLKYDFVIRPGGKASDIKMKYEGATAITMRNGAVTAITPMGSITEQKPYSYNAATRKEVASSFVLKNNVLGFNLAPSEGTVVIDPSIAWGTYYGEDGANDYIYGTATDTLGNVYIAGETYSDDLISWQGHQMFLEGLIDGFIVKFDNDGNRLWATYYGAAGEDRCDDITVGPGGDVYVCGTTDSPFGLGLNSNGGDDAYLGRFNPAGLRLWTTYYGGVANEQAYQVTTDKYGDIYMVGSTASSNNISTPPLCYQAAFGGGGTDGFIAKYNPGGTLLWGSYLGKMGDDRVMAVTTDNDANFFIAAETSSKGMITTPGAYVDTLTGNYDLFLMKFTRFGVMEYASYLYYDHVAYPRDLATDNKGNIHMVYNSVKLQPPGPSIIKAHIRKFDNNFATLWHTTMPDNIGFVNRVAIDPENNVYVAGETGSPTNIATSDGHQVTHGGGWDGFITKYTEAGVKDWGSYYGGMYNDRIKGLAVTNKGKLFISGHTNSPNNMTTPGTHKDGWVGSPNYDDAFIAKFHDTVAFINPGFADTLICPPDSFNLAYSVQVIFGATNTFTAQLSDANGSFASPLNIGYFTSNQDGVIQCGIPATIAPGNGYRVRIVSSSPVTVTKDNGRNIRILERPKPVITGTTELCANDSLSLVATSTVAGVSYQWNTPGGTIVAGPAIQTPNAEESRKGKYIVTASNNGCAGKDSISVTIHPRPYVTKITTNSPVCEGKPLGLAVEGSLQNVSYLWVGPGGYTSTEKEPVIPEAKEAQSGRFMIFMKSDKGCVSDTNGTTVDIVRLEATIAGVDLKTPGDTLLLMASANRDSVTWSWTGPNGFISNVQNPVIEDITMAHRGDYYLTIARLGCTYTTSTFVRMSDQIKILLYPNPNSGIFTVRGNTAADQVIEMEITDAVGKAIYRDSVKTFRKHFTKVITLPIELPTGVYILRLDVADRKSDIKFVIMK